MNLALANDPTGIAAHASGRGLSVVQPPQFAVLSDVCEPDTVEVLRKLELSTSIGVVKRPGSGDWTIWQAGDLMTLVDAFLRGTLRPDDPDVPDSYTEAWRDLDDNGTVEALDQLSVEWLEHFGAIHAEIERGTGE